MKHEINPPANEILSFKGEYGDISERKALRNILHCKSFDWYVRNVNPELKIPETKPYAGEVTGCL